MDAKQKIGRFCKETARVIGFILSLLVLVWIIHNGYELTTKTKHVETGGSEGTFIGLVFGVITVVLGLIYFIIGLTIVAEMSMDMLAWLEKEKVTTHEQEKDQKTICQIFIQISITVVSVFMLIWVIYYGYKIAAEAQIVAAYNRLTLLIGIITMAFGFVYLIIRDCTCSRICTKFQK